MRILLLLIFAAFCVFVGYNIGVTVERARTQKERSEQINAQAAAIQQQQQSKPVAANDPNARARALDGLGNFIQTKSGAKILDKKAYESMTQCEAAIAKVAGEYQRRGIPSENMADASAFTGMPGKVVVIMNNREYYYLGCLTNQQVNWVAYVQFSLTEAQVQALSRAEQQQQQAR